MRCPNDRELVEIHRLLDESISKEDFANLLRSSKKVGFEPAEAILSSLRLIA